MDTPEKRTHLKPPTAFGPQAPPSQMIEHRLQRSVSICNTLERQPVYKLAPSRTRTLSISSTVTHLKTIPPRKSRVAQLRENFEVSKPTETRQSKKDKRASPDITEAPQKNFSPAEAKNETNESIHNDSIKPEDQIPSKTSQSNHCQNQYQYYLDNLSQSHLCAMSKTPYPPLLPNRRELPFTLAGEYIISQPTDIFDIINRNLTQDDSLVGEQIDLRIEKQINFPQCLEEVYTTEVTYVKILFVLHVKLPGEIKKMREKDETIISTFNNIYKPFLDTIQRIYKFHHETILPQMEEYKTGHRTGNMWAILGENFKIIEDLYKVYYVAYDDIQRELEKASNKHVLISEAMLKTQSYLNNLCPVTQFNCANQRLLRYILLMKTYIKHLNETSSEYEHTCFIHDELERIAERCDEQLAISPTQFNNLKARFDKVEYLKNQELVWHGLVKKQSLDKNTDIAQRYIILLTDCILICRPAGPKLDRIHRFELKDITINADDGRRSSPTTTFHLLDGQQFNRSTYSRFHVNAGEKFYDFLLEKESDRDRWVRKIRETIEAFNKRHSHIDFRPSNNRSGGEQLGKRVPQWINNTDVTRCQSCNNPFRSKISSSGQYHCRACGRCICSACSTEKLVLEYCKNQREVRVCDRCYTCFTGKTRRNNSIIHLKKTLDLTEIILFGDFRSKSSNSSIWIALEEDYQLHIYGGKLDQIEDYSIKLSDLHDLLFIPEIRTFKITATNKTYKFSIELNHHTYFQKNNYITEQIKQHVNNRLAFFANLWHEAMQDARSQKLPEWYTRKRDSADSGISVDRGELQFFS